MSASFGCKCGEHLKPVEQRNWEVLKYKCNHSAFNGYKYTPSDYSTVVCNSCRACGRTKAAYVDKLRIAAGEFRN